MRDQNGVELFGILANRRQARDYFLAAEARIHQDACLPGGNECAVTRTAAGKNTDFENTGCLQGAYR